MGNSAKSPLIQAYCLVLSILILSACGGGGKRSSTKDGKGTDSAKKELKAKAQKKKSKSDTPKKKAPVLPTTLQVAASFKKAGLPYKPGVVLSPDKVGDLVNPDRKKLAFGAYSADLAYLVLNEKGDQGMKVMSALMKLAKDLNLSSVFNTESIAERFRTNIDKRDSLVQLIVEVQQRFDTYVAKNRTRKLRTIAYAGGWTEAIYLAAKTEGGEQNKVHLQVEEQMTVLEKLLKALERDIQKAEGPLAEMLKVLKGMDQVYEKKGPKPGKKISEDLMKTLKKRALKARKIISKPSS